MTSKSRTYKLFRNLPQGQEMRRRDSAECDPCRLHPAEQVAKPSNPCRTTLLMKMSSKVGEGLGCSFVDRFVERADGLFMEGSVEIIFEGGPL